jgi:hypothetical protein
MVAVVAVSVPASRGATDDIALSDSPSARTAGGGGRSGDEEQRQ